MIRWMGVRMDGLLDLWVTGLMRDGLMNGWKEDWVDGLADLYD